MTEFILLSGLITALTLWVLIRSLRNNQSTNSINETRQQQNTELAQSRLAVLERQYNNKQLNSDEYTSLKSELERTLADDLQQTSQLPTNKQSNKKIIITLALLLPLSAISIYLAIGTPNGISHKASTNHTAPQENITQAEIQEMVTKLETRLKDAPNDQQGWQMLARTYLVMGRYTDATQALKNLIKLTGDDPSIYAALADTGALANQGVINAETQSYINKALNLQPMHPQALWLAGIAKMQKGEDTLARQYWNALVPLLNDSPDQQQQLKEIIQQSYGAASDAPLETTPRTPGSTTQAESSTMGSSSITVNVSINPDITAQLADNDVVFVFAKALQGPPAPLAVKRLRVKDLPTTITLSDADAMIAQFSLSKFDQISVNARVSKSGDPIAQSGDIESDLFKTNNDHKGTIQLIIYKTLP